MSTDQIRWKINALCKKYKECVDNNRKSGLSPMTFEYFDQLKEIMDKDNNEANVLHTRSFNLPKKTELETVTSQNSTCSSTSLPTNNLSTNNSHKHKSKKKNPIEKKARLLHESGSNNA